MRWLGGQLTYMWLRSAIPVTIDGREISSIPMSEPRKRNAHTAGPIPKTIDDDASSTKAPAARGANAMTAWTIME